MMCSLVTGTKKSLASLGSASLADKEKYLETWSTAIKIFHVLVTMLKTHDARTLMGSCLRVRMILLLLLSLFRCIPTLYVGISDSE